MKYSRRKFIKTGTMLAGSAALSSSLPWEMLANPSEWTLANSMRSNTNPYHATFARGGELFAQSIGAKYQVLVTEGNSEKGISDVRALLARTEGKLCLNIDPNDSPDARVIVEDCAKAGAYVVTQWNKPNDLHPWDYNPNYVAHMSFSGVPTGKHIAEVLIKAMGGKGGIVGLGGILSNVPAIERRKGLEQAVAANPNVEILDYQAADWNETKAFEITQAWLTRFGRDIGGIFGANDGMAIGALEALREAGLAGEVPVVGIDGIGAAVKAIEAGELAGTVAWDPNWTGGMGLSIAYHTAIGKIKIAEEPHSHREFYGPPIYVTPETVKDYKNRSTALDYNDFWGKSTGQIQYG
ncbi:MAG: sugar ABC transporter substrate-binding protein [SAR324 cluster bacterium]|nr:sugar ABC transporter substrate-binding protein [SAR324 cluster bacterium]